MGTVRSDRAWRQTVDAWRVVHGQSEPLTLRPLHGERAQPPGALPVAASPPPTPDPARSGSARRSTRSGAGPVLEEFDWDSLRRSFDEEEQSREMRAQNSLAKLNSTLRARQLRRR